MKEKKSIDVVHCNSNDSTVQKEVVYNFIEPLKDDRSPFGMDFRQRSLRVRGLQLVPCCLQGYVIELCAKEAGD